MEKNGQDLVLFPHTQKQLNSTRPRVRRNAFDVLERKPLLDDFCREGFYLVKMRYEAPAFSKS
jgi:hypothetical protein